jgi:Ca-activated chloride channel family protein
MRDALAIVAWALVGLAFAAAFVGAQLGDELRFVTFAAPAWLAFAALPVLAVLGRGLWGGRSPAMPFTRTTLLAREARSFIVHLAELPDGLRLAAAIVLGVALAQPQSNRTTDKIAHEGIDIAIALDLSESMKSGDLPPNRLEAAKQVIDDFVARRPHDRIALVVFGSEATTVAPLTHDHDVLRALVQRMRLRVIEGSSTAIGAGLGLALNRLEESEAATRIVVLLTDGLHNADGVDPDTVAREAKERGIVIYTVLMGQQGGAVQGVDPRQLERIAATTGGAAYRALDVTELQGSFQALLDRLEKSEIASQSVRAELFHFLLWPALLLLLLDVLLRSTRLRRFP